MATPLHLSGTGTPTRLSVACQQIVSESFPAPGSARVVIRSSLSDPNLWPVVGEHKCNGVTLTPSGLYADMAATVAQYIWKRHRGYEAEAPGIRIFDLDVERPLIVHDPFTSGAEAQWIEMEAVLEPSSAAGQGPGDVRDGQVHFHFRSVTASGTKLVDLAHCSVTYEWWPGWLDEWAAWAPAVQGKIERLAARARTESSGRVQLVHRARAYELFCSFVDYGPPYQNMAEVVFDADTLEGTSLVEFRPQMLADGLVGPYYLDGSCHLSGFVCNAVEQDRDKNAYISHGVEAVRIAPTFDPTAPGEIRTYVRMEPLATDKTVLCGDVYVLQGGFVVGIWEGVKFKRIPRRVLNVFLPPPKKV